MHYNVFPQLFKALDCLSVLELFEAMASYASNINPFTRTLCVPFYYLWPLVILSELTIITRILYAKYTNKYHKYLEEQKSNLDVTISTKLHTNYKSQLQQIQIQNKPLPNEIINIIMSMIPEIVENWEQHAKFHKRKLLIKWRISIIILYIYPTIKFFANFINFITIMIQYGKWHNSHENLSNWDKYCAFILVWFYMPTWKGRGLNSVLVGVWIEEHDFSEDNKALYTHVSAPAIGNIAVNVLFGVVFGIMSFPIWISGIFVYIPTLILFAIISVLVWFVINVGLRRLCNKRRDGPLDDMFEFNSIFLNVALWTMVLFTLIIVCAMEFYSGQKWVDAYRIGFFGEYCERSDYFEFGNWDEYDWKIQFLIISWFIF